MSVFGKLAAAAKRLPFRVTFSATPTVAAGPATSNLVVDRPFGFQTFEEKMEAAHDAPDVDVPGESR